MRIGYLGQTKTQIYSRKYILIYSNLCLRQTFAQLAKTFQLICFILMTCVSG